MHSRPCVCVCGPSICLPVDCRGRTSSGDGEVADEGGWLSHGCISRKAKVSQRALTPPCCHRCNGETSMSVLSRHYPYIQWRDLFLECSYHLKMKISGDGIDTSLERRRDFFLGLSWIFFPLFLLLRDCRLYQYNIDGVMQVSHSWCLSCWEIYSSLCRKHIKNPRKTADNNAKVGEISIFRDSQFRPNWKKPLGWQVMN